MKIKYPEVKVQLTGAAGNGVFVLGRVQKALRLAGVPEGDIRKFTIEATSGDYDNLLATCMKWVDVS